MNVRRFTLHPIKFVENIMAQPCDKKSRIDVIALVRAKAKACRRCELIPGAHALALRRLGNSNTTARPRPSSDAVSANNGKETRLLSCVQD